MNSSPSAESAPNADSANVGANVGINVGEAAENGAPDEMEVALQIPSDAEFVRVVRLAVMGVASRMPFSYDDIEDIKLAVSEACNNAILHARVPPDQARLALGATSEGLQQTMIKPPIVVRLLPYSDRLEISVEDGGRISSPGLLAPRVRKPVISPDEVELPEGGMGLFLIQSLMDEVQHHSGENSNTVIHMTKYLPRDLSPTRPFKTPETASSHAHETSSVISPSPDVAPNGSPVGAITEPLAVANLPEHLPAS